ncbi:hypothetical protein GXP67_13475 [Rhodocytophaga rosea]|uniref:TerB family tellurite resistance protein n=1 Tax=Rhodocytophaga rosea TaxID=2704465 RepID=A0A6C0GHQ3_9BACT|nr:hypothetical protein [Rhodocytophaga rosea]QHT67566.1 hypothetical protein GXP67_13475 [Rhodocytophaga rosea]
MNPLDHLSKKGKSYIKQLLQVAMADGQLDEKEFKNLMNTAHRFDFSEEEVLQIRHNLDTIPFTPPTGTKDTFHLIFDLAWMMMVDGHVYEKEMLMCENLAMRLGFAPEMVADLVGFIKQNIAVGATADETYQKLEKML